MQKRNPYAMSLRSGVCQPKVVAPKKGRGSYTRKDWHREGSARD